MSDSVDELERRARAELCEYCHSGVVPVGNGHPYAEGRAVRCLPSSVLALIDRLRAAERVEAAARAYVEARRADALIHWVDSHYAALVKALEGGGDAASSRGGC